MNYCQSCGTVLDTESIYCSNCGTKVNSNSNSSNQPAIYPSRSNSTSQLPKSGFINQNSGYNNIQTSHYQSGYNQAYPYFPIIKKRTTELTIVLVLQYLGVAILSLITIFILNVSLAFGLIILLVDGLLFWLVYSVQQYSNTARWIMIILLVLSLIDSLVNINVLALVIGAFQIYVLAFHEKTVALFTDAKINKSYYSPSRSY